jgi:uncharacterized protein YvpB
LPLIGVGKRNKKNLPHSYVQSIRCRPIYETRHQHAREYHDELQDLSGDSMNDMSS